MWAWGPIVLLACALFPSHAFADPQLRTYETRYYLLHTDLPEPEAREAQLRMTRLAEEYLRRTAAFSGQLNGRLPFFLYSQIDDYLKAGGIEGSGGVFDGQRLMAVALRRPDHVISLSAWHIVQHEGFHQFAHAAIGGNIPMWADEGLAEYFGEGLFTGDNFETGLIPQSRLARVQRMLQDNAQTPLRQFQAITRDQWNDRIVTKNYDQAWSFVHFLAHADDGRLRKPFEACMLDLSRGGDPGKCYDRHLASIPNLEARWRDWWLNLPDHPTADLYARATLEILTSFLARAHLAGERFESFDRLVKTPPDNLKQPADQWLPPTLLAMAAAESQKMRTAGATFILVTPPGRPPTLILILKDRTRLAGRITLTANARVDSVRVDTIAKGSAKTQPATSHTATPHGEMLR
ncbi:MAG TPA: DUF1570 domain-containing protein [Tepidisphaeraceae bacterium]